MAIDISTEDIVTLSAAAKSLPGRPSVATVWRWRVRGVRGIKLETILIGGTRHTSKQALQRFADRLTALDGEPVSIRTPHRREAEIARAERDLAAAGI